MDWYILKVAKGQDQHVKTRLLHKLKATALEQYVAEIVIPTEQYVVVKNGKRVTKERNLLSGYVLLNADLQQPTLHNAVLSVKGALGFINDSLDTPARVPLQEVERLVGRIDTSIAANEEQWIEGETVKIVDGPFSSFEGKIKSVEYSKQRAHLEVKVFGRTTDVSLEFAAIQKIS